MPRYDVLGYDVCAIRFLSKVTIKELLIRQLTKLTYKQTNQYYQHCIIYTRNKEFQQLKFCTYALRCIRFLVIKNLIVFET